MKVAVNEIPEEGIEFLVKGSQEWFETFKSPREKEDILRLPEPFNIKVNAYRVNETVKIRGKAEIEVELRCSRCGEWFMTQICVEVNSEIHPIHEWVSFGKEEVELKSADMDIEYYSAGVIDLDEVVAESIFLALPYYPICREDCRGLCPVCGANRNRETCLCSTDRSVDGWKKTLASLKEQLDKKG